MNKEEILIIISIYIKTISLCFVFETQEEIGSPVLSELQHWSLFRQTFSRCEKPHLIYYNIGLR